MGKLQGVKVNRALDKKLYITGFMIDGKVDPLPGDLINPNRWPTLAEGMAYLQAQGVKPVNALPDDKTTMPTGGVLVIVAAEKAQSASAQILADMEKARDAITPPAVKPPPAPEPDPALKALAEHLRNRF